jgi:hypothetical protein
VPIIVKHRSNLEACSVSRAGVGMVQSVVERAKWSIGDKIEVGFIENAKCLLLRSVSSDNGFKLAYANTRKKSGGRVFCNAFIRNYLSAIITLPKKNLAPILPKGSEWDIALLLEPIDWSTAEFTKTGCNTLAKDSVGVYELLGNGNIVLRIGEGKLRDRINAHLQDSRFTQPTVKTFRYLLLADSIDSQLMEKILIEEYEDDIGVLPRFQEIRA